MLNKNYNRLWALGLLIIGLLLICISGFLTGCQHPDVEPLIPTTPGQALVKTVLKTDWVVSLAIVGFAISIAAFINGNKMAVGTAIGCGAAIWMQLTVVRYAHVLAWVGLVFAVGIMLWTVFVKNRALKEVVAGIQDFKDHHPSVKEYLGEQNKTTQKIVSQIKGKLPGKEK